MSGEMSYRCEDHQQGSGIKDNRVDFISSLAQIVVSLISVQMKYINVQHGLHSIREGNVEL